MTTRVHRFDVAELRLDKAESLDNGWMRVSAVIGRVGVFEYRDAAGKVTREYRPPEEVLDAASVRSFEGVPLTNDHPPVRLDGTNARAYSAGSVGSVKPTSDHLDATVLVQDVSVVALAQSGKRQLSPGYTVELDMTPGTTPNGEKYDAVQRKIRGNHVALVQDGRQGAPVSLRMDAGDAVAKEIPMTIKAKDDDKSGADDRDDAKTVKVMVGDDEFSMSAGEAKALRKQLKGGGKPAAKADDGDELAALRGRCDALEAALKKRDDADKERADSEGKRIDARVELVSNARRIIGDDFKADGKSDAEVMAAVVLHVDASAKDALEQHKAEPAYIRGRYDVALGVAAAKRDEGTALIDAAKKATANKTDASGDPIVDAKAKADADRADAWKPKKPAA